MSGLILDIQRMSTEDGPGLRTTVFLKGCPLACRWCHNPESLLSRPEVVRYEERCIGCGSCAVTCPHGVPLWRCEACGEGVEECPAGARERLGTAWEAEALADELARDRAYFGADGGVTVSGGEPAAQPVFVAALLDALAARGVSVALDTCGQAPTARLLGLAARVDLVLFDVKAVDSERHARLTGRPSETILANATALADQIRATGRPRALWVRTPLVPGATATEDNVRAVGAFVAGLGSAVERWELCAFNDLCADKYRRLGREWPYAGVARLTAEELRAFGELARQTGVRPERVHTTGPTTG